MEKEPSISRRSSLFSFRFVPLRFGVSRYKSSEDDGGGGGGGNGDNCELTRRRRRPRRAIESTQEPKSYTHIDGLKRRLQLSICDGHCADSENLRQREREREIETRSWADCFFGESGGENLNSSRKTIRAMR